MGMFSSFGNEPQPIGMMQNFTGEGSQPQPVPMIKGLQQPGIAPRIGYTQPLPMPMPQQPVAGPVAPTVEFQLRSAVEPDRQFEQYQPYFQQMRQNVTGLEEALKQFEQTLLPGQQGRSTGSSGGKLGTPGMF